MSHFVTYLALGRFAFVAAKDAIAAFEAIAGDARMQIEAVGSANSAPGSAFVVAVGGTPVTVMFIDKPLPPDAWNEAVARSIVWRSAAETMRKTHAHVIVALLKETHDHSTALKGAAAVTMVAAALARCLPVAAVVFTEAQAIARGGEIEKMAKGFVRGQIPDMLWTTLSFMRGPQTADGRPTAAALTTGLLPFLGWEIEFQPMPLQPAEIAERLIGLCRYLIDKGPIINDGETVGLTEKEKIRARYAAMGRRPGIPVMQMALEVHDPSASGAYVASPPRSARSAVGAHPPAVGSLPRNALGKRVL